MAGKYAVGAIGVALVVLALRLVSWGESNSAVQPVAPPAVVSVSASSDPEELALPHPWDISDKTEPLAMPAGTDGTGFGDAPLVNPMDPASGGSVEELDPDGLPTRSGLDTESLVAIGTEMDPDELPLFHEHDSVPIEIGKSLDPDSM